jgi:hypothetical protein
MERGHEVSAAACEAGMVLARIGQTRVLLRTCFGTLVPTRFSTSDKSPSHSLTDWSNWHLQGVRGFRSEARLQRMRQLRSHLSFALPSAIVCHCVLNGASAPPHSSGLMWSITYGGQAPLGIPVDGQGCSRLNAFLAAVLRL